MSNDNRGEGNKNFGWNYPSEDPKGEKSTSAQKYDKSLYFKYKLLKVIYIAYHNQNLPIVYPLGGNHDYSISGDFNCWNSEQGSLNIKD